jgi:hypothetical protein
LAYGERTRRHPIWKVMATQVLCLATCCRREFTAERVRDLPLSSRPQEIQYFALTSSSRRHEEGPKRGPRQSAERLESKEYTLSKKTNRGLMARAPRL